MRQILSIPLQDIRDPDSDTGGKLIGVGICARILQQREIISPDTQGYQIDRAVPGQL